MSQPTKNEPRSKRKGKHSKLYERRRWKRLSKHQRRQQPLCEKCLEQGRIRAAEIAHHVVKHEGAINAFFLGKLQSLCRLCHEGETKVIEQRGYSDRIGPDGFPTDPQHPWHMGRLPK